MKKICVFCGKTPKNKNKEHILPQWLLSLTGDPNRIVTFGHKIPEIGLEEEIKEINFNWKALTVPSCTSCNDKYAKLESSVSPIIESITKKEELKSDEIILLLDWLDKVRIGLWLNYYYLEKNKGQIEPRMFIENRIGRKDRFLQIHFLESKNENSKGLNAFGVETFAFQNNPSCFALRINNILIINASNDFAISKECGFPYPEIMKTASNGMLSLSNWSYLRDTANLKELNINKGVLTILQPIQSGIDMLDNYYKDSYLQFNCLDTENKIGRLFRVSGEKIEPIYDMSNTLHYESVTGNDIKYIGELISKTYEKQNYFIERISVEEQEYFSKILEINNKYIKFYRNYHKET